MLLILILLKFTYFLWNVAALDIVIQSDTIVGQPSLVLWTREPSDGNNELTFDLRFVRPGLEDAGLAVANIQVSPSIQFGTVQVVFPSPGPYQLMAVSDLDDTNLGESNQVNAIVIPTTSASPTSTSPIPSATSSVNPTPTASGARHKKNLGAIIGGTLGGVAFLGLLVAFVILFLRRRHPENRRWTFHRDLMIRPANRANPDIRPTYSTVSRFSSSSVDIEGLPHGDTSSSPLVMIASQSGPRPLVKPIYRSLPIPPILPRSRQEDIVERMEQVRNQMTELQRNPEPTQQIMLKLNDMQRQLSWLQAQIGSPWALGLTDVAPLGLAHNLAY